MQLVPCQEAAERNSIFAEIWASRDFSETVNVTDREQMRRHSSRRFVGHLQVSKPRRERFSTIGEVARTGETSLVRGGHARCRCCSCVPITCHCHRKRQSRHHASGCRISRNRRHLGLFQSTAERMAAHRRLDPRPRLSLRGRTS
jgi:hypothetical protein